MQHVGTALHQDKVKKFNSGNGSQSRLFESFGNAHKRTTYSTRILQVLNIRSTYVISFK